MKHINLTKELMKLCSRNRDGSFATQAARRHILALSTKQLVEAGFHDFAPQNLKPKHIDTLLNQWQVLSPGTIKNRMAHLRWWAGKVGKINIMAKDNSSYGVPKRKYVTNLSKAKDLDQDKLAKIQDPLIRCSLELQRAFGLRREESLKFQPRYAVLGDKIRLKASWTKGGKYREIPIRNDYQNQVLKQALLLAKNGSLIPPDKSFIEHLKTYETLTNQAGLKKMHGLRHAYAQERYQELTQRLCPAAGGKSSHDFTKQEKTEDLKARLQISQELGHEREEVTAVYLGR
ncbi:MAG: integrase domain-containing protein [Gammaproteobacteria bacterium]|nr:integrase domain-containing protein [Gammaproteobacteria bacterium]